MPNNTELHATLNELTRAGIRLTQADGVALVLDSDSWGEHPLKLAHCGDERARPELFAFYDDYLRDETLHRTFNGARLAGGLKLRTLRQDTYVSISDSRVGAGRGSSAELNRVTYQLIFLFRRSLQPTAAQTAACEHSASLLAGIMSQWVMRQQAEYERETALTEVMRFRRRAELDGLTLVENAASFRTICESRITVTTGQIALVLIDLDHFKSINDIYGHQFGDDYLRAIGRSLGGLRALDAVVGRIGGDEFAMMFEAPQITESYLKVILHQVNAMVQRDLTKLKKPGLGRMSMGVSLLRKHGNTFDELFRRADAALYAIKAIGRNGVAIFDENEHAQYDRRSLGLRFERALELNEISPYYQPIVDLETRRCIGFEALARWNDPVQGVLPPASFQAILSDHSQVEKLTRTMAHQALGVLAAEKQAGWLIEQYVSLNVTHFDLLRPEFVFDLQEVLSQHGLTWDDLTIEVTEQTMLGDIEGQVFRTLAEIRMRGARVALDDFGTGYGGLMHLKTWPIDIIKIDRSFISALADTVRDKAIVQGLIQMADHLGLEVIAEGIETEEDRTLLLDMGCRFGQGYLFSPAVPHTAIRPLLSDLQAARDCAPDGFEPDEFQPSLIHAQRR
ncbi:putative bifunctional diguanylate cyclase/phosphodiesterase [Aquimixticola soesokkakensis]|uniref:putative bifunctional diguanylate cyclase/phosphodiesterase n=1 Tax=Aquimixticola soesokkakensis TaxID=1519096 RepID=UPI0013565317|nr:bifunctional diguanylate cyclase/phosphodiesterase [Aquimixticola soesokkakensis]